MKDPTIEIKVNGRTILLETLYQLVFLQVFNQPCLPVDLGQLTVYLNGELVETPIYEED